MSGSVIAAWVEATLIIFGLLLLLAIWVAVLIIGVRAVVSGHRGRRRKRRAKLSERPAWTLPPPGPGSVTSAQTVQFPYREGEEGWPGER